MPKHYERIPKDSYSRSLIFKETTRRDVSTEGITTSTRADKRDYAHGCSDGTGWNKSDGER